MHILYINLFSEVRTCLQNTRVALIGDSRIRGLYYQLAETVSVTHVPTGKKVHLIFQWSGSYKTYFCSWTLEDCQCDLSFPPVCLIQLVNCLSEVIFLGNCIIKSGFSLVGDGLYLLPLTNFCFPYQLGCLPTKPLLLPY